LKALLKLDSDPGFSGAAWASTGTAKSIPAISERFSS
jgi:hypothetical protein